MVLWSSYFDFSTSAKTLKQSQSEQRLWNYPDGASTQMTYLCLLLRLCLFVFCSDAGRLNVITIWLNGSACPAPKATTASDCQYMLCIWKQHNTHLHLTFHICEWILYMTRKNYSNKHDWAVITENAMLLKRRKNPIIVKYRDDKNAVTVYVMDRERSVHFAVCEILSGETSRARWISLLCGC